MSKQRISSKQSSPLVQPLPFWKKFFIPILIAKSEKVIAPLYKVGGSNYERVACVIISTVNGNNKENVISKIICRRAKAGLY